MPNPLQVRLPLILLLCSAAAPGPVHSQSGPAPAPRDRVWFSGGIGIGKTGSRPIGDVALSSGVGLTYQPGPILFSTRLAGDWNYAQGDLLGDLGLLVGLGTRGRYSHFSVAVGPALTGGNLRVFRRGSSSFSSRLGAAFQVQALALPFESIGLGITGFADLNSRQSFGGVMFTLAAGQVR